MDTVVDIQRHFHTIDKELYLSRLPRPDFAKRSEQKRNPTMIRCAKAYVVPKDSAFYD
ncbi:hypothetical protein LEP1GSC039_2458 [Leptospira santarosai str. 2000027870]|nr:hypothetical protein LEP1GSC039_2458 [Leptospira santarosai str. 2000027870]